MFKILFSIFLLMLSVEFLLYYFYLNLPQVDKVNMFTILIILIMLFFSPLYIVSGISHVARSWDVTVFEISMLGGWLRIAVARIVATIVYMVPYIIVQSAIIYLFVNNLLKVDYVFVCLALLLSVYIYAGLALLLSLLKSRAAALIASTVVLFISPLSVSILVNNYLSFNTRLGLFVSAISYLFNPLLTYWYSVLYRGFVQLEPSHGVILDVVFMAGLYLLFILLFRRTEIKI